MGGFGSHILRSSQILRLQDSFEEAKSHIEVNAIDKAKEALAEGMSLLAERQKLILLPDKPDFVWKTVDEYVQHELAVDEKKKSVVQKKGVKRRSSPRFQERRQGRLFLLVPRLCGPLRLVPLGLLVLLRLLILLPLAINGCPFLGVHPKLLLGPVTVFRVVSLVTGDLNAFRVRVDRKVIRIAGD